MEHMQVNTVKSFEELNTLMELYVDADSFFSEVESEFSVNREHFYYKFVEFRLNLLKEEGYIRGFMFRNFQALRPVLRIMNAFMLEKRDPQYFSSRVFEYEFETGNRPMYSLVGGGRCSFEESVKEIKNNFPHYKEAYEKLADAHSKSCFFALLMTRLTGDLNFIISIYEKDVHYFDPTLILSNTGFEEVFVDVGGYTGDTALEFAKQFAQYNRIYLYEPNRKLIKTARRNLEKAIADKKKLVLRELGVSDSKGKISFQCNGSGGRIGNSDSKADEIELTTLDEDILEPVTFIKMDIEGAEMAALRGAAKHIREDAPKLAICTYHLPGDVWRIMEFIHSVNDGYEFYLRQYHYTSTETVLYAIPQKN